MAYASRTDVPIDRSRSAIEALLKKHGANNFAFLSEIGRAVIIFEMQDRRIRFDLPFADGDNARDQQQRRSRWRALLLCIKAKLEAVESKIETFEESFLAHVVMPDGATVMDHARPRIAQAYKDGEVKALLPPRLAIEGPR